MSCVLIVTSEQLGPSTAGPGLRALGIATGLQSHGIDVAIAAPAGSTLPATIPHVPLDQLAAAARTARAVIIPAALVKRYPEAGAASRLIVDFPGPYPLEAQVAGRPPREVSAAEHSVADALCQADLVVCSQPLQIEYSLDLLARLRPTVFVPREAFALVPFGAPSRAATTTSRTRQPGLRLVWPGGLWDWLDPLVVLEALTDTPSDVTIEFWGAQNADPGAPRMAMANRLRERVTALGLEDRVTLVDWVPRDVFDERLAMFDVAVTFDDGGEEARHAFRTRLLHALALGVPTLATQGEFVADLAASRGAGWTVPTESPEQLRRIILELRDDPSRVDAARQAALNVAKGYDYTTLVAPLLEWLSDNNARTVKRSGRVPIRQRLRRALSRR